jgi:hypothetical protein
MVNAENTEDRGGKFTQNQRSSWNPKIAIKNKIHDFKRRLTPRLSPGYAGESRKSYAVVFNRNTPLCRIAPDCFRGWSILKVRKAKKVCHTRFGIVNTIFSGFPRIEEK